FPFSAAPVFSTNNLLPLFPLAREFLSLCGASRSSSKKTDYSIRSSRYFNRKKSSLTEKENCSDKSSLSGMEKRKIDGIEAAGFNKERAEGRDGARKDLKLKVRKLNPINTICYVQILGTGMDTQDTSPSVLLFFDNQRFIFNAGEGLQRFCNEHKIKLSKIDHIFLSRVCSQTAGGLPGLLLTLGEEGMSVNVWGPLDFKYLVDAMKSFISNTAMVHARSFGPGTGSEGSPGRNLGNPNGPFVIVDDEVVKISALLIKPVPKSKKQKFTSESAADVSKPGDVSVVYICELPEIKGKFDPKKAAALGLRPGPKYRDLQLGKSVKSDKQDIMIHPSDILDPSIPGPIVLLVDCPTALHLQYMMSLEFLTPYYHVPEGSKLVNCVIHLTPSDVASMDDYQMWMSRFGDHAHHIMAGHEMKNVEIPVLKSSSRIAARLNYLCPQFFPSPGIWSLKGLATQTESHKMVCFLSINLIREGSLIPAENLLKFHLRPYANLGVDYTCVPSKSSSSEIIDELLSEIPEISDATQRVARFWSDKNDESMNEEPWLHHDSKIVPSCLCNITREDTEIVLLGTGSSHPSKYRNVSSILINLFSKGSILLDCGEGTLGQLRRRFGVERGDEIVRGLKCIWISHIHADHHAGLARILALRRDLLRGSKHEPLVVVGPEQLKQFLDAYQLLEDLDMQFLDCADTKQSYLRSLESNRENRIDSTLFSGGSRMRNFSKKPHDPASIPILNSLKRSLNEAGLEGLISFRVLHCPHAFGISLQASKRLNSDGSIIPGWKIVYSGDTRPCPKLVKAAHGATVLIHEATFEDGMMKEAITRNHSTTKEAVEVGDSAGAYRVILTHFSQRYPKIPVFDEAHMHRTCVGFDMMSVNLADVHLLPRVLPFLKLLFRDEMVVDETEDDIVAA
ncbi:hypothetical protein M569_02288, partial [Genlisea aurea]